MKKRTALLAVLLAGACAGPPKPPNLAQVCGAPPADAGTVADLESGNQAFALALFATAADGGGNLVLSPYSVSTALDLAYAGAQTSTAAQMAQVLGLGSAAAAPGPAVATVACQAETDGSSDGNQLSIANALFGQKSFSFTPAFLSTLKADYGAPLQTVDFESDQAAAVATIDAWVSTQTDAMIPKLLSPGDVDSATRLVLVNALYFKGTWESGFDPGKTQPGSFTLSSGAQVSTPLMTQSGPTAGASPATFGFFKGSGLSIAELPYKGEAIALDLLLPDTPDGLPALVAGLTPSVLQGFLAQLQRVALSTLTVPRFKIDTHLGLSTTLQALGLTIPFDPTQADFSGMDGAKDLFLQTVIHEAIIEVDETGTTASAATAVGVGTEAVVELPSFLADHPFLFALRDLGTGTLLFVGQVTDPTQG